MSESAHICLEIEINGRINLFSCQIDSPTHFLHVKKVIPPYKVKKFCCLPGGKTAGK